MITTVFGFTVAAAGIYKATDASDLVESKCCEPRMMSYRKVLVDQGRLLGVILLNKTADVGVFQNLIVNRKTIPLPQEKLCGALLDMRKTFFRASLPAQGSDINTLKK